VGVLRTYVASVPEYEYERLRRVGARRGHRADTTHPPAHRRRDCLPGGPRRPAAVKPDTAREQRISGELAAARTDTARRILRDGFGGQSRWSGRQVG
jgi:hypothetical protein